MDFIKMVVLPVLLVVVMFLAGAFYFVKYDCESFASIQNTTAKATLTECYVKYNDEWITKDRWFFYKAFDR